MNKCLKNSINQIDCGNFNGWNYCLSINILKGSSKDKVLDHGRGGGVGGYCPNMLFPLGICFSPLSSSCTGHYEWHNAKSIVQKAQIIVSSFSSSIFYNCPWSKPGKHWIRQIGEEMEIIEAKLTRAESQHWFWFGLFSWIVMTWVQRYWLRVTR